VTQAKWVSKRGGGRKRKINPKNISWPEQLNFSSVDMKGFGVCGRKT